MSSRSSDHSAPQDKREKKRKPDKLAVMAYLIHSAADDTASDAELRALAQPLKDRASPSSPASLSFAENDRQVIRGHRLELIRACLSLDKLDRVAIKSHADYLLFDSLDTPDNRQKYDTAEARELVKAYYLTEESLRNADRAMADSPAKVAAVEPSEPAIATDRALPNQLSGISNAGTKSSETVETEPLLTQQKTPSDDDQLKAAYEELAASGYFDAPNNEVAGKRVMRAIAQRQGQLEFRKRLIVAYQEKCVVTDCSVVEVLEAAHIKPFCEEQTYSVSNGLLLRSDIHTLFDKYLMGINPDDFTVTFAEPALRGKYKKLNGKQLRSPIDETLKPSQDLLRERWQVFCARTAGTACFKLCAQH